MSDYRWNENEVAVGYDAAAEHVHPYYRELQAMILDCLPFANDAEFLLVDAGGGSGRLAKRFLEQYGQARVLVLDQSESFLELARARLAPFGTRADVKVYRLQDDWQSLLPEEPAAIVSMSAVHHLNPWEKRDFYSQCARVLRLDGILLNGDEVRHDGDDRYLEQLQNWAEHMERVIEGGLVSDTMAETMRGWQKRNIEQFDLPRQSGDDCHETSEAQINYLRAAGFFSVDVPWHKEMWAVLRATR